MAAREVYRLRVSRVGAFADEFLTENKIILFAEPVPDDLADYCVVHIPGQLIGNLSVGQILRINDQGFKLTAVGQNAGINLQQLGHITLNFDGATVAELPGMIHLQGLIPEQINTGDIFTLCEPDD